MPEIYQNFGPFETLMSDLPLLEPKINASHFQPCARRIESHYLRQFVHL